MDDGHGLVVHPAPVLPYSNELLKQIRNMTVLLAINLWALFIPKCNNLSKDLILVMHFHHMDTMTHSSTVHGNSSITCQMSSNWCTEAITSECLQLTSPRSKQCFWPNLSGPLKDIFMFTTLLLDETVLLAQEKTYLPILRHPHQYVIILITKYVSSYDQ